MPRKRSLLLVQLLLFLLGTLLAVAIDNLTGLEFLRQQALPLAGSTVLLIIGVMICGWIVVSPVVPGDHPLRSLARSLATADSGDPADEVQVPRFVDELRTSHGRPSAPVLVIVDQAEELITLSGEAERDAFLGLLARALDADPRLWIIMIMRTELLNAFLGTEQARLFRDPVTVGTLSHAALVEVIEQPARRAGR